MLSSLILKTPLCNTPPIDMCVFYKMRKEKLVAICDMEGMKISAKNGASEWKPVKRMA